MIVETGWREQQKDKRRKSKELRKTFGFLELTHVTKMTLRSAGKTDTAKRCNEALKTNPKRALRITEARASHAKDDLVLYTQKSTVFVYWSSFDKKSIHKNSK